MAKWLILPESDGPIRELVPGANTTATPVGYVFDRRSAISRTATAVPADPAQALRSVLWSGSLAEHDDGATPEAIWESDPRTWASKGWNALQEAIGHDDALTGCIIRPHSRHVVSDLPGCRRLLASDWATARNIDLLFDPVSMLAPSMLGERVVEDHLRRLFDAVLDLHPSRLVGVIVSGFALDDRRGVVHRPLSAPGVLEGGRIVEIAMQSWRGSDVLARVPIVLHAGDVTPDLRPHGPATGLA